MSDTRTIGFKLELGGGKYTYIRYDQGGQEALRYGEPWRDLVGDNLVLFFGFKVEELESRARQLERELNEAKEREQKWKAMAQELAESLTRVCECWNGSKTTCEHRVENTARKTLSRFNELNRSQPTTKI